MHLFGNSLGGARRGRVAATRPDLVRTLTLISPAMPFIQPRSAHARMLPRADGAQRRGGRWRQRLRAIPPRTLAHGILSVCFADMSRVPPQRMAEAVAEATARQEVPWAAEAYLGTLRGLAGSFLVPGPDGRSGAWRRRITAPTLIVWGRQDRLVDVALAPRTADADPGQPVAGYRWCRSHSATGGAAYPGQGSLWPSWTTRDRAPMPDPVRASAMLGPSSIGSTCDSTTTWPPRGAWGGDPPRHRRPWPARRPVASSAQ